LAAVAAAATYVRSTCAPARRCEAAQRARQRQR